MFGGLFSPVSGLLGSITGGVSNLYDGVQDVAEQVAPGSMDGKSTTGNLLADDGAVGDLLAGLEGGDVSGAVTEIYADVIGPGGVINNLGEGGTLGIEGLLGNTLGLSDGLLGSAGGLTDDLPLSDGSLL